MSNGNAISAVMLPQGSHVSPEPILMEASSHTAIQEIVGGWFDVVTVKVSYGPNQECVLVGYVNDEGMLLPDMDLNYLATALFKRELYGNVVVVSGTHPDTGEYDGESYDVPDWAYEGITNDVVTETADAYNDAVAVAFALRFGPKMGVIPQDEADDLRDRMYRVAVALSEGGELPEWTDADEDKVEYLKAWAVFAIKAVEQRMNKLDSSEYDEFDAIIADQFEQE